MMMSYYADRGDAVTVPNGHETDHEVKEFKRFW